MAKSKKKKPAETVHPDVATTLLDGTNDAAETAPSSSDLAVIYDRLEVVEYSSISKHGPLTSEDARIMLGWETEADYQKRMVVEDPNSKPEHWLYGDEYHCTNTKKEKIRCSRNTNNRPFDSRWCEDLIHTILSGQWAGPLTVPGETVNGETVRIGRYGRVMSGQHQLTALVLADEFLAKSRAESSNAVNPKYPFWNGHDHPVIETLVVFGLSEDERILRTIDYVKPRTVADMLHTMDLFRQNTTVERKEMTRMLAAAVDTLWDRTDTRGYKTHTEIVGFLERHGRLLDAVVHIFVENSAKASDGGRKISKLRLSAGQASALCYLMGSSGPDTDGDLYRNQSPPSQRDLDWSYWDRAQLFWTALAGARSFFPVRTALGRLLDSAVNSDENQGQGGRGPEKLAILASAWSIYKDFPEETDEQPFSEDDLASDGALCLSYSDLDDKGNQLPDGRIKLLNVADFGGIDCQDGVGGRDATAKAPPMPPPPTREEIDRLAEEARDRREEQKRKLEEERAKRKK